MGPQYSGRADPWHPPATLWGYSSVAEHLHGMQEAGVRFSLSPQMHFGQVDQIGVRLPVGPRLYYYFVFIIDC